MGKVDYEELWDCLSCGMKGVHYVLKEKALCGKWDLDVCSNCGETRKYPKRTQSICKRCRNQSDGFVTGCLLEVFPESDEECSRAQRDSPCEQNIAICPHCDEEHTLQTEDYQDGEIEKIECNCGKIFYAQLEMDIRCYYNSAMKEGDL